MRLRILWPVALVAISGVLLAAACDSSDSATTTPSPTFSTSATVTATANPRNVIVDAVPLVEALRPSVVHILSESTTFNFFGQVIPQQGVGTGIILDTDGHIATNNHVITDSDGNPASKITITLADGRDFEASIVGRDPPTDLAVLKIDANGLTPARLGVSASLKVGQQVIAMGNALDLAGGPTVTQGVVSALGRLIQEDQYTIPDAIQTDASINPGNSGGPLVNAAGDVIGITTAVIRGDQSSANAEGIGLAISIDSAKPIIQDLIDNGSVQRAIIGLRQMVQITASLQAQLNLPVDRGVGIGELAAGGPADVAGLENGDIVVAIDGEEINTTGDLFAVLAEHEAGETVTVGYYHGDQERSAEVTLG
jgi:serine protease Do